MLNSSILNKDRPLIALIPARKGSKGVINKNRFIINGRPLIDYTILEAKASKYIDQNYISSDDNIILDYAKKHGINPIKRPKKFSSDSAPASAVVKHFISKLSQNVIDKDPYIIYLQPTSPLRNASHIDDAFDLLKSTNNQHLVSVSKMQKSPFKALVLNKENLLENLFEENMTNHRRQDLPDAFVPNGAIYIFTLSFFLDNKCFPSKNSYPFIMDDKLSLDIDTQDDIDKFIKYLSNNNL